MRERERNEREKEGGNERGGREGMSCAFCCRLLEVRSMLSVCVREMGRE